MKNFLWLLIPFVVFATELPSKVDVSFETKKALVLITKSAEPTEIVPVEPAFINDAYQIGTAAELKWFEEKTNATTNAGLNKNAVLTADIDYGGNYWIPIAAGDGGKTYTGTFDGAGYKISNLVLSTEWLYNKYIAEGKSVADAKLMIQNSGFIGSLKGTIKNMTLENVTVYSNANGGLKQTNPTRAQMIDKPISVGAIVGWIAGTDTLNGGIVDNITVSGNLEAEGTGVALGGIVGNAGAGKIINSTSMVTIKSLTDTSEVYIGGITGYTKNSPVFRNDKWLGEIIVNAGHGSSGGVTGYVYSGTLTVDNVEYNEEGVEDAVGKSCDKCAVSGDLDYGIYKIYTVENKKVCEIDGSYKHVVQDGVFTVKNTVDSLVFDREFVPGKSSTFSIPFSISTSNIIGAAFYTLQDVVKNDTGYQVNLISVNQLEANKPYIIVANQSRIYIKKKINGFKLQYSAPSTTSSSDKNWELQSIYKYTTGADRGDRREYTYGFVARDTIINGKVWNAGQFVKMGSKSYIFPFRVLLEFVGDVSSLPKATKASVTTFNYSIPEKLDVNFIQNTIDENSPTLINKFEFVNYSEKPRIINYKNKIFIKHKEKKYNIYGKEIV